ncbi:hypothetical protein PHYBOEH_005016 [Phytophthora boehmeriae]|uniref:PX domain-containing protein n=1 Tax=Phytophthora boehmeriae TaxID=109152 RepID=A0A8T1WKH7_9STRA|nr:hypothetical protein PHYBOEH_005016 [Phytophthora boehmeriae]
MLRLRLPSKSDADVDTEPSSLSPNHLSPTMSASPYCRLSQLSTTAKSSMSLNEIYHVQICSSYRQEDGATVYVVNVFLKKTQKGLPTVETLSQRKRRLRREQESLTPDYQVEHRYSDFRAVVKNISAVVNDHDHFRFCAYCSRVGTTESAAGFPPRVPSRGPVRQLVTSIRKSRLEHFVNEMLRAAKDNSYRSGSGLCHRFLIVSELLHSFLTPTENV